MNIRPSFFVHDPSANLDYHVDWSDYLQQDRIVASAWEVSGGLTIGNNSHNGLVATAFVSGGTHGADAHLVNTITTAGGRTDSRTLLLRVRDR